MTELTPVKIIIMSETLFYVIPNDVLANFYTDLIKLKYKAFHDKYDKYKVFGDLNQIQFFADIKS